MGLNFYDYHDFQKNQGGYRIMKYTVHVYKNKIQSWSLNRKIFLHALFFQGHKLIVLLEVGIMGGRIYALFIRSGAVAKLRLTQIYPGKSHFL